MQERNTEAPALPESKHILLMDDNALVRADMGELLSREGYDVVGCGNATEAIAAWSEGSFDLVITDIFIVDKGGFVPDGGVRFLGWLRPISKVPVIAMSGFPGEHNSDQHLRTMAALGADVCLRKPIDYPQLLRHVHELIEAAERDD